MALIDKEKTGNSNKAPEISSKNSLIRRILLGASGRAAVALILGLTTAETAYAEENKPTIVRDAYFERIKDTMSHPEARKRLDESGQFIPEKLSETEILLMDQSVQAIFKHYLQPAFQLYAIGMGEQDNVTKAFETVIDHPEQLHFHQKGNTLVITKRPSASNLDLESNEEPDVESDFRIEIRDGFITKVGKFEIKPNDLAHYAKEWKKIRAKVMDINLRFLGGEETNDKDLRWFGFYSIDLPKKFKTLMIWKEKAASLNYDEEKILLSLQNKLENQPTLEQIRNFEGRAVFYSIIRPAYTLSPTPEGMIEMANAADTENEFDTFATFSFEGFAMINTTPDEEKATWVRADSEKTPFANAFRKKHK